MDVFATDGTEREIIQFGYLKTQGNKFSRHFESKYDE